MPYQNLITLEGVNFIDDKRAFSYYLRNYKQIFFGLDQTQKVMLALQDKDSLLKYLANAQ
jgi:hypothetical protein